MFGINRHSKVYLTLGATDLRKSINTLSLLVQGGMKLDPFCGHYFGFCNRRRNLLNGRVRCQALKIEISKK
jgi:transposase